MGETIRRRNRSRKYTRYPVLVRVTRHGDAPDEWCSVNLSEGGMFVEAVAPMVLGARTEVGIRIDHAAQELMCEAEVMWRNDPDDPSFDPDMPAGMGLQFIDLPPTHLRTLREFLTELDDPTDAAVVEAATGRTSGSLSASAAITAEANTQLLATGTVLGSYRILGILGQGGMGTVYLAEHVRLGREVALKRLHPKFTRDPDAAHRFFEEARLVNQIHHEHITEITDFITEDDHHYFVMELLTGTPLSEMIAHHGNLPLARAVHIGLQLCDVLEAVHAKDIIHRDLKPENILLVERDEDRDFVKLVDFGIAKLRDAVDGGARRQTAVGTVVGTPGYIAPEIVLGNPTDHRADIYGFGVVFYQMVVGHLPFQAEKFDELIVKQATELPPSPKEEVQLPVPPEVEELIMSCLDGEPGNRPESMAEIAEVLRAVDKALWATDEPSLDEIATTAAPRPSRTWIAVVVALMATAGVAGALLGPRLLQRDQPTPSDTADTTESAAPPRAPVPEPEPEPEMAVAAAEPVASDEPAPGRKAKKRKRHKRRGRKEDAAAETPSADGPYERGLALLRERKAILAAGELEQAVAATPNHAEAFRALGKAYVLLGREEAAVKQFERYVALKPNAKDATKLRAMIDAFRTR